MTLTLETPGSTTCKPRFCTPRDPAYPTFGPQIGEVARRIGRPLMPWQQDLVDVAYEYDPATGLLRYDEVDVTVPRQSGKTTVTLAKKVWRLTAMSRAWGPQRSTYTAQTRLAARKKLERDFGDLLRSSRSFREVANAKARPSRATEWRLSLNNGSEAIQFGAGSFLQIDAPSRTGGHGDTLDDGTIDEAFSQEDDTVEGAMRPAMATRRNAQLWVISTAGDARSYYLYRKVVAGRAASESGSHGRVCYVEYSAADDADPGDPATWWSCMPALGLTITVEFIRSEWERAQRKGQEGIDTFRRAYLNQWPSVPALDDEKYGSIVNAEAWDALAGTSTPPDDAAPAALAVDRWLNGATSIAAAWHTPAGVYVELVAVDVTPDNTQVLRWLRERAGRRIPVLIASDSTAAALVPDLHQSKVKVDLVGATDYARACVGFVDDIARGQISHAGQPEISAAMVGAKKRTIGVAGSWGWDRKSPSNDISPLVAATLARLGAVSSKPKTTRPGGRKAMVL